MRIKILLLAAAAFAQAPQPQPKFPLSAEQKATIYKQLARIERIKQAQNEVRDAYMRKLSEEIDRLRAEEQKAREQLQTLLPPVPDGKQLDDDLNLVDKPKTERAK